MGKITFNIGDGNLGRGLVGEEAVSGMLFLMRSEIYSGISGDFKFANKAAYLASALSGQDDFVDNQILDYFERVSATLYVKTMVVAQANGVTAIPDAIEQLLEYSGHTVYQLAITGTTDQYILFDAMTVENGVIDTVGSAIASYVSKNVPVVAVVGPLFTDAEVADAGGYTFRAEGRQGIVLTTLQRTVPADNFDITTDPITLALGTTLAEIAATPIGESIAYVKRHPMQDYIASEISTEISSGEDQARALAVEGVLAPIQYRGDVGIYLNGDVTLAPSTSDFAVLRNQRAINKGQRVLYRELLPEQDAKVLIDPATGQMAPEAIGELSAIAERALVRMQQAEEISAYTVYIDPAQDVLATDTVVIEFSIIPYGAASNIKGYLSLKKTA